MLDMCLATFKKRKKRQKEEERNDGRKMKRRRWKGAPPGPLSLLPHLTLLQTPSLHFIQPTSAFIVPIRQLFFLLLFYLCLPPSDAFYFPCLLLGPNHASFHSIKLPSAIDQPQPLLSPLLPYVMQLLATFMQPRNNFY